MAIVYGTANLLDRGRPAPAAWLGAAGALLGWLLATAALWRAEETRGEA